MSMLYLWHPSQPNERRELNLILTAGDSNQIGAASERFVRALLETLGVSFAPPSSKSPLPRREGDRGWGKMPQPQNLIIPTTSHPTSPLPWREGDRGWGSVPRPTTWTITPHRSNYYSEYWREDGWEFQWDFIWRLTLKFAEPVTANPLPNGYLGIDNVDDHSPAVRTHVHPPFRCLAIASFPTEKEAIAAAKLVGKEAAAKIAAAQDDRQPVQDHQQTRPTVPPFCEGGTGGICLSSPPPICIFQVSQHEYHLHADLGQGGESFFTSTYPNSIVSLLETNGGRVHAEN